VGKGRVRVRLEPDGTSLDVAAALDPAAGEGPAAPGSLAVEACELRVLLGDLHFDGSASAWLLERVAPELKKLLNSALRKEACPQLKRLAEGAATRYLENVLAPAVRAAAAPSPDLPPPEDCAGGVQWGPSGSPLAEGVRLLNRTLSVWPGGAAELVNEALGPAGSMEIPGDVLGQAFPLTFNTSSWGGIAANVSGLSVRGVHLSALELPSPASLEGGAHGCELEVLAALQGGVEVFSTVTISVDPHDSKAKGPVLDEAFAVRFRMGAGGFGARMAVELDGAPAPESGYQCLADRARAVEFLAMDVDLSPQDFAILPLTSGGLEHDLDKLVSNISVAAIESYEVTITAVLKSLVGGRVRDAVNTGLLNAVAEARKSPLCSNEAFAAEATRGGSSDTLDLSESPLVKLSQAMAPLTQGGRLTGDVETMLGSFPWEVPVSKPLSARKIITLEGVEVAAGNVTLLGARIVGFDSVTATPPVPVAGGSNGTLSAGVALEKAILEVDVSISEVDRLRNCSDSGDQIRSTVVLSSETLSLDFVFTADVDAKEYSQFNGLGPWNPLCYFNSSRSLEVVDLQLLWNVTALEMKVTAGDPSGRLQKGLQNMIDEAFTTREGQPGLDSLVSSTVSSSVPLLNKVLAANLPAWKSRLHLHYPSCFLQPEPLDPAPYASAGVVDWSEYGPYMLLDAVVNNLTPGGLAEYVNSLAKTYGGPTGSFEMSELDPRLVLSVPAGPWGSPVSIHVSSLSLGGLDSFSTLGPLNASSHTSVVQGGFGMGGLQLRVALDASQAKGIVGNLSLSASAGLRGLDVHLGSQLAFNESVLEVVPWESGNASCISRLLFGSAAAASILDLAVAVTPEDFVLNASGPSLLAPLLQDLGSVVSTEIASTQKILSRLVAYAFQGPVKGALNAMLATPATYGEKASHATAVQEFCPSGARSLPPKPIPPGALVDWKHSVGFGVMDGVLGYFGPDNLASFMDDGLASIVGGGGVLQLEEFIPSRFLLPDGPWGTGTEIEFLNGTFEGFSRLKSVGPFQAYSDDVVSGALSVERIRLRGEMHAQQVSGLLGNSTVLLDVEVDDVAFETSLQMFLDKTNLGAIPWVSGNGTCIAKDLGLAARGANVLDLGVGMTLKNLTFLTSADSHASEMFKDLSVIFANSSRNALGPFISGLTRFAAQGPVKAAINTMLEERLSGGSLAPSDLEETGFLVGSECGLPAWDGTSRVWTLAGMTLTILMFGFAVLSLFAALCLWLFARREPKPEGAAEGLDTPLLESEEEAGEKIDGGGRALLLHPRISRLAAGVFSLILSGNVAMFIWSNAAAGASVFAFLTDTQGFQHKLAEIKTFTLFGTVTDMWAAQVYALSILIAVLSGIWPYVKLFSVALACCLPEKRLGVELRTYILTMTDALGKWSLLDAYVLMMMTVAFRLTWSTPERYAMNPGSLPGIFDVLVQPQLGCYTFLTATNLSLVVCHVASAFNRLVTEPARDARAPMVSVAGQLGYSLKKRLLVACAIAAGLGGIILASVLPSFSFTFGGLTGKMFESQTGSATRDFSLLSLALEFPSDSKDLFPGSLDILQVCLIIFSVAMPFLHLLTALALWCVRTSPSGKAWLLMASEITYAWSAIDVFIFTLLVSLSQIERFSLFVIGHKCDALTPVMEHFSDWLEGNPRCFDVTTALLAPGTAALVTVSAYYTVLGRYVMRCTRQAVDCEEGGLGDELTPSSPRPFRTASEDLSRVASP